MFDTMLLHVEDDLNAYARGYLCAEEACQLTHVHTTNQQLVDGRRCNQKQVVRPWLTPTSFLASREEYRIPGGTYMEEVHLQTEKVSYIVSDTHFPPGSFVRSNSSVPQHTHVCSVPMSRHIITVVRFCNRAVIRGTQSFCCCV